MAILVLLGMGCAGSTSSGGATNPANIKTAEYCDRGFGDACALLGMSNWLHAEATDGDRSLALTQFLSACELGDWLGCAMAGSVQASTGTDAHESAKQALGLAQTACEGGSDASACAFVGDWAARADEAHIAKRHYSRACGLAMTATTRKQVMGDLVCKRAISLGAAQADLLPIAANLNPLEEAKRIGGTVAIHPPDEDAKMMHRMKVAREGAELLLCLSEAGVPRKIFFTVFSNFPSWNQKIFETVRAWRYSPMVSAEGKKVPVCTSLSLYYLPQR